MVSLLESYDVRLSNFVSLKRYTTRLEGIEVGTRVVRLGLTQDFLLEFSKVQICYQDG